LSLSLSVTYPGRILRFNVRSKRAVCLGRRKKIEIELEIEDLVFGGRGLAHHDERVVFVENALPGDRVKARVHRRRKDFWEARTLEVLRPSSHRQTAPCPYFGHCGGCKWQNLPYPEQLRHKHKQVDEALRRIGGLSDFVLEEIIPADPTYGYRNKMEFSFASRRWLRPEELGREDIPMQFALGLHVPGTFEKVLNIDDCLLQSENANAILREVQNWSRASGLPAYDLKQHTGILRFLVLRQAWHSNELMLNLVTSEPVVEVMRPLAEALQRRYPQLVAVVNGINARKAQVAFADRVELVAGRDYIRERLGHCAFNISVNSFFQTNTRQAEKLYAQVAKYAGLSGAEEVFDLYCGTGSIAIYLAADAAHVTGIEVIPEAIGDARANAAANGLRNTTFLLGDVREMLVRQERRPQLMILDPPRAGMHADVIDRIITMAPARLIYVSCNPTTMARDVQRLQGRFRLDKVRPVDMFPHTYHIESVALLNRRDNA
jgi:23S rRNA (uracil1939-C5)-methyltransferase